MRTPHTVGRPPWPTRFARSLSVRPLPRTKHERILARILQGRAKRTCHERNTNTQRTSTSNPLIVLTFLHPGTPHRPDTGTNHEHRHESRPRKSVGQTMNNAVNKPRTRTKRENDQDKVNRGRGCPGRGSHYCPPQGFPVALGYTSKHV